MERNIAAIWVISDGKPGHLNQSLGLAAALQKYLPASARQEPPRMIAAVSPFRALVMAFSAASNAVDGKPAVLIAAGHRTHLTLLALKKAMGVPAVVLMKPSLPLAFFDLCLIPEHDEPPQCDNVVATCGAINRMQAGAEKNIPGIMLIGGINNHYHWHDDAVLDQIGKIAGAGEPWLLTTSRRTPAGFLEKLSLLSLGNIAVHPFAGAAPDWLAHTLPSAKTCWVTPDSVSMVYEALTAGCRVGLFDLEKKRDHRVVKGIARLEAQGLVGTFNRWCHTGLLPEPAAEFNEAQRCARIVYEKVLTKGDSDVGLLP